MSKTEKMPRATIGRDGRPLDHKIDHKMGRLTTGDKKRGKCHILMNKCLRFLPQKRVGFAKCAGVFFLGKSRENNKNTYEQMFARIKVDDK